jgi:hypothetical protein
MIRRRGQRRLEADLAFAEVPFHATHFCPRKPTQGELVQGRQVGMG